MSVTISSLFWVRGEKQAAAHRPRRCFVFEVYPQAEWFTRRESRSSGMEIGGRRILESAASKRSGASALDATQNASNRDGIASTPAKGHQPTAPACRFSLFCCIAATDDAFGWWFLKGLQRLESFSGIRYQRREPVAKDSCFRRILSPTVVSLPHHGSTWRSQKA